MLHSVHKRNESVLTRIASIKKTSDSQDTTASGKAYAKLRREAAIRFVAIDLDGGHDDSGDAVIRRVHPCGRQRELEEFEPDSQLGWTLSRESLHEQIDWGTIVLSPGTINGEQFIVDDFKMDSPHAFRRRF